jgi:ribose-phosphate pyrophosphokinase
MFEKMNFHNYITIDLTKPDHISGVTISRFPDGQQNVKITRHLSGSYPVLIKSRFTSFKDLELIICTVKSLRRLEVEKICLYIPYLLGARSDRQFSLNENSYLVDVIAPILNAQNFHKVFTLDVHSHVAAACINNLTNLDNTTFVKNVSYSIYGDRFKINTSSILISPDAGASHKIYNLAKQIEYTGDIITCSKERDTEGNLTKVNVPYQNTDFREKDFIIIDDICDGGATFINIAKHLNNGDFSTKPKVYLIVTHGIFSKGFSELSKYFDGIYCTNSYRDIIVSTNNETSPMICPGKTFKQFNIF